MTLNHKQLQKAGRLNPKYARRLGWKKKSGRVITAIGANPDSLDEFSQLVSGWQRQNPPLDPDGILGPKSWKAMKRLVPVAKQPNVTFAWLVRPIAPSAQAVAGREPLWYRFALAEQNRWNEGGEALHERDTEWDEDYFIASPYWGQTIHDAEDRPRTNADWCAAFVNWCLHRAGFSHSGSAGARSFLHLRYWTFDALETPEIGCVIVMNNPYHVGFLASTEGLRENPRGNVTRGRFDCLGGNQRNTVRVSTLNASVRTLLAARGQNGVRSPYLMPLQGSPNCNIDELDSARGHFCRRIRDE